MNGEMAALGRILTEVVARSRDGYLLIRGAPAPGATCRGAGPDGDEPATYRVLAVNALGHEERAVRGTLGEALCALNEQLANRGVDADLNAVNGRRQRRA